MNDNPAIFTAIEALGYRVTVGDVAVKSGLDLQQTQQGLMTLAADAGGHLQVSETGEIVYLFPQDFRGILLRKFWQLRLKNALTKTWQIIFYGIRISFGIILILSILIMLVAIIAISIAMAASGSEDREENSGGGINVFLSPHWFNIFYLFDFSPDQRRYSDSPNLTGQKRKNKKKGKKAGEDRDERELNFLEAIFSFLFGDGNPNADLEERRWQSIGAVIQNHDGAIVAEQVAPFLDNIDPRADHEDYMLPVLLRFNGYPEVSPQGEIIYAFPELQVRAQHQAKTSVPPYLKEAQWRFSAAKGGQMGWAIGLGIFNFVLAVILGGLLLGVKAGGYIGWVISIYGILLLYAIGFLTIPVVRWFVLKWRNQKVKNRNRQRKERREFLLQPSDTLEQKINYAQQFAQTKVLTTADIAYSTEEDLLDQEVKRSQQIDQEWQRRLGE